MLSNQTKLGFVFLSEFGNLSVSQNPSEYNGSHIFLDNYQYLTLCEFFYIMSFTEMSFGHQDLSWSQQYCNLDGFHSSTDFQFLQFFF